MGKNLGYDILSARFLIAINIHLYDRYTLHSKHEKLILTDSALVSSCGNDLIYTEEYDDKLDAAWRKQFPSLMNYQWRQLETFSPFEKLTGLK